MAKMEQTTPNQLTTPVWLADFGSRDHLMVFPAKLNAADFTATNSVVVTTTALAAANATSISVSALSAAIPAGTLLFFDTSNSYATLTATANASATSLTVAALATPVLSGDKAIYGAGYGRKLVPAGTLVGRTLTERDNGTGFGPADIQADEEDTTFDHEIFLTLFDVVDAAQNPDVELVRPGAVIKENFLPGWASYTAPQKAWLRAHYHCIVGRP